MSDNIVYDIVEDVHTHTLWIGTRVGLSIMKQENPGTFINYKSLHSAYHIPCDEINSLLRDRFNNIWLGSIGGGVLMIDTKQSPFAFYSLNLAEDDVPTTAVRALFADADKDLWLGTGSYGLARKDYETGVLSFFPISRNSRIFPVYPRSITLFSVRMEKYGSLPMTVVS